MPEIKAVQVPIMPTDWALIVLKRALAKVYLELNKQRGKLLTKQPGIIIQAE